MLQNIETLHCLIGEQQISNFIPILHINPEQVVLWYTDRTNKRVEFLEKVLKEKNINCIAEKISAYDLMNIIKDIEKSIKKDNQIKFDKVIFNLTGGTKLMALGSFLVCQKYNIPFCYLQSEGGKNYLYSYIWKDIWPKLEETIEISSNIRLEDYIRIHVGGFKQKEEKTYYEKLVIKSVEDIVDEIISNIYLEEALEVDMIFRIGNQVGIAEIKTRNRATKKEGIDQLNTAGGREYFGTYTKKFLIVDREYPENNKELAAVRGITVIELKNSPANVEDVKIDEKDKNFLIQTIVNEMAR
jgi:hypothetical protein